MNLIFQSTRPVRGATDAQTFDGKGPAISIHAPRAGRDIEIRLTPAIAHRFQSTRPVRGATTVKAVGGNVNLFQSTRPVRGATFVRSRIHSRAHDFNPRAPCGARPGGQTGLWQQRAISIHAPRAGRDGGRRGSWCSPDDFNPRAPCGARHDRRHLGDALLVISIHAPRAGRDFVFVRSHGRYFISIHAPRAGRDPAEVLRQTLRRYFNPRAPCGARRPARTYCGTSGNFNPRAPCGARLRQRSTARSAIRFQSTRPVRGATTLS